MITRKDIEELNAIRAEKRRLEKLDKELTAKLIENAEGKLSNIWKGLSYEITEGHTTTADKDKIKTLPDWESYYKTTTYPKLTIKTGK